MQKTDPVLLARTLMCFGRVDNYSGWTSGGEKRNFFYWDKIRKSDAFKKFVKYLEKKNPESLEEIIEDNLENSQDLKDDSFRYTLVSRPEIISYCKEGNFGWVNDGKKIVLLQGSKAVVNNVKELYTYVLQQSISSKYHIYANCSKDKLSVSFNDNHGKLEMTNFSHKSKIYLEFWNDGEGKIQYELNTSKLHGNSLVIRNLKETGWDYNEAGNLYFTIRQPLKLIANKVERNIERLEKRFDRLLKAATLSTKN